MTRVAASFSKIDYTLRPAKNVERKMLVEAFRKLEHFSSLDSYQYVGFGSVYFADFALFHRELNIQKMYSIEDVMASSEKEGLQSDEFKNRLTENMPYRCIELIPHNSSLALSQGKFDYNKRSVFWLDYDYHVNDQITSDLETLILNVSSGSVILITLDARKYPEDKDDQFNELSSYENFKKNVTRYVSHEISNKSINNDETAPIAYWSIVNTAICENIASRNLEMLEDDQLNYKQLFHFNYADKALMTTIGGIVYSNKEASKFENCNFCKMPFYSSSSVPFRIHVPRLTFKEIFELGKMLPSSLFGDKGQASPLSYPGIKPADLEHFQSIYRYIPRFGEFIY